MREDNLEFERFNVAGTKEPRFVIRIVYTVSSPYFTSKLGISNVPGVPVQGVLSKLSGNSQQLFPKDGRTTIGGFNFQTTDLVGAVTDELRTQLSTNSEGIRGRTVEVYKGWTDDFNLADWRLINSYVIRNVEEIGAGYKFICSDITREVNQTIFDQKKTELSTTISDTDATFTVTDTTDFDTVFHPNSFTDGPGLTVGYLELPTGEIVRYTGKTATTFTGIVRSRFGTQAEAIEVDPTIDVDRRPEIKEFIYLEMPAPMLAYAVITGIILGTSPAQTLPSHWHTGVATSFVRLADFQNIGLDLFDPNDVIKGMIPFFNYLTKTTGKAFVERELHRLMGTFSPIYSTGEIGLKRMNRILADAPFDIALDHSNITRLGALKHDQQQVINRFRIDWNWNGERFTRFNAFQDSDSIATHGESDIEVLKLRGLHGARHTVPVLKQLTDTRRDRFSGPPEIIQLTVLPSLEVIEVGDVVRVQSTGIRDYAGTGTLDRSFEVQRRQENHETGEVQLLCFGSSQEKAEESPTSVDPALPDAWYSQEGIDLDSLAEVTGGAITSNLTLTGTADMNAAASVWYHLGALTLNTGITLTLNGNVQLRIRGFFTVNGDIDGIGNGIAGTADAGPIGGIPSRTPGAAGLVGTTRSGDGLEFEGTPSHFRTLPGITVSAKTSFPQLQLLVETTGSPATITLAGIPTDQRGTGGSHGAAIVNDLSDLVGPLTVALGGNGGNGGAGLAVICRGLGTGASASVDLTGAAGTAPAQASVGGIDVFPGSGAGGGSGAFLILLDGNALTVPDLTGKYTSAIGNTPEQGTPGIQGGMFLAFDGPQPFSGVNTAQAFANKDNSNSTLRIQFVPQETGAAEDVPIGPSPPTGLAVRIVPAGIELTWTDPGDTFDRIEIFRSLDNDRSNSILVDTVAPDEQLYLDDTVTADRQYFYWIRSRFGLDSSDFDNAGASPDTSTAAIATFVRVLPPDDFVESFDNYNDQAAFEVDWEDVNAGQGGLITFPQDAAEAELGGRLLQTADSAGSANGEAEYHRRTLIPYDPKVLYKITVRARQTVAPGTGGDQFFAGVTAVAEDGITLLNTAGADSIASQHYHAANNFDMASLTLGEWKEFVGYFTGESTVASDLTAPGGDSRPDHWTPGALRTGAKYFRPMFISNQDDGDGTMQVAWWKVEILPKPFAENLRDPTFDLREDDFYWNFVEPAATIINAGGEDGSNAMELNINLQASPNFAGNMTPRALIKKGGIRARISIRYQMTAATGTSFQFQVTSRGYKLRPGGRAVLGSDSIELDNSTDLTLPTSPLSWDTKIIHVTTTFNQSDAVQFTFGFVVGSVESPGQIGTVRVQSVEIQFYDVFLGADSQFNLGYVPDPGTEQSFFLRDDGNFSVTPQITITPAETAAGVTPTTIQFPVDSFVDLRRYLPANPATDGNTDYTSNVNDALSVLQQRGGGTLLLPHYLVGISSQLVFEHKMNAVGHGPRVSGFNVLAGFPVDTPIIKLGTSICFNTHLENLGVRCNSISGCQGVYSKYINEHSGLRHVFIENYMDIGVFIEHTGGANEAQNFFLDDIELGLSASAVKTTLSSLTQSAGVATGTTAAVHGFSIGDVISIIGANEADYLGSFVLNTIPTTTTFTFRVATGAASPATGTIEYSTCVGLKISLGAAVNRGVGQIGSTIVGGVDFPAIGMLVDGGNGHYDHGHVENLVTGVFIGPTRQTFGAVFSGWEFGPDMHHGFQISNGRLGAGVANVNLDFRGLARAATVTNILRDDGNNITITDNSLAFYTIGGGTPGSTQPIGCSSSGVENVLTADQRIDANLKVNNILTIQNSGKTDWLALSHDDTNFNFLFTNTANATFAGCDFVDMTGGIDLRIRDAGSLKILDSGDTDQMEMFHDGTNLNVAFANTISFLFRDGIQVRIQDSTDADWVEFAHDGIDFNMVGTNTTDLNISGMNVKIVNDIGFYNTAPIAQQTGVAVSAAAIHAALVALGLITA